MTGEPKEIDAYFRRWEVSYELQYDCASCAVLGLHYRVKYGGLNKDGSRWEKEGNYYPTINVIKHPNHIDGTLGVDLSGDQRTFDDMSFESIEIIMCEKNAQ
jgi:hypothetical protein